MTHDRIPLGISACLLGEPVRFDGGHTRDPFLVESLGRFVEWVPVCPEVESGLDAPRESMRLVQADGRVRLLTNKTAQDHTTRMRSYARRRVEELAEDELCGYVLKKDSPTCGLERVKVYGTAGAAACRRRRAAQRSAAAGELRRTHICLSSAQRIIYRTVVDG